jgi:hypothetical protein
VVLEHLAVRGADQQPVVDQPRLLPHRFLDRLQVADFAGARADRHQAVAGAADDGHHRGVQLIERR